MVFEYTRAMIRPFARIWRLEHELLETRSCTWESKDIRTRETQDGISKLRDVTMESVSAANKVVPMKGPIMILGFRLACEQDDILYFHSPCRFLTWHKTPLTS